MSLLTRLFTHRVPLQISVPIVVACAAAGFFASGLDHGETARGASQMSSAVSQGPVATSTIVEPPQMTEQTLAENPPQPLAMAGRGATAARRGGSSAPLYPDPGKS